LKRAAGIDLTHVPFKGGGPAIFAVIGGQVEVMFSTLPLGLPHVRTGKLRALAVTSKQRAPLLPDVPTMSEAGLEGFEAGGWYGLVAPAGIPQEIVNQLHAEAVAALKEPEMAKRIAEMASPNITSTPQEFKEFIAAETQKWKSVLLAAKPQRG